MNTFRNMTRLFAFACAAGIGGCAAAVPPQDLVNARSAYHRASNGPAQQLDRAGMHSAKEQLDVAEASFAEDGDTQGTRDQSYLAVRKTEMAEVIARTMQSNRDKDGVVGAMHADEKNAVARTSAELARSKARLSTQGVALLDEKSRREAAELRAAQAAADLAKFAKVEQEPRGMVITLSGSVLFASGKADLLPTAQVKLNDVANALAKEDPHSKIVVEGHTDSKGTEKYNQDLSQRRAQAVRDYLVTRGIASDRITAQGFGFTRSVANNASPEGRANNRRVEIVIQPATPAP
jgi:outer membrane protein OmpA-like peptidoglycan-associated protein